MPIKVTLLDHKVASAAKRQEERKSVDIRLKKAPETCRGKQVLKETNDCSINMFTKKPSSTKYSLNEEKEHRPYQSYQYCSITSPFLPEVETKIQ